VLYGDSHLSCDYAVVADAFEFSDQQGPIAVYRNEDQWDTSNVKLAGNRILAYDKVDQRAEMRHIEYGPGVFRSAVFAGVPAQEA
jgi:N-acetyl-alpha-D-muramate 1-phosphate uridylyltransferase